jgi:hypothetical protein
MPNFIHVTHYSLNDLKFNHCVFFARVRWSGHSLWLTNSIMKIDCYFLPGKHDICMVGKTFGWRNFNLILPANVRPFVEALCGVLYTNSKERYTSAHWVKCLAASIGFSGPNFHLFEICPLPKHNRCSHFLWSIRVTKRFGFWIGLINQITKELYCLLKGFCFHASISRYFDSYDI